MVDFKRYTIFFLKASGIILFFLSGGCVPDLPVTSTITVDIEKTSLPVNPSLYGLTLEEINHGIEGGLYAELIRNRSFEEGLLPLHSAYDRSRGLLVTPNRWTLPFPSPESVPGWSKLSDNTFFSPDMTSPVNEQNKRALAVSVFSREGERGGVIAKGYNGILLKKGKKYDLSFYVRSVNQNPCPIYVALEDSSCTRLLSNRFQVLPSFDWKKFKYEFTAKEDLSDAVLTVSTEESASFSLDEVSLFPRQTWKERRNGWRDDLMKELKLLSPQFIRFPGGVFVEGYTNGTYPVWKESIGPVAERRHFWNVWGYGTSNGMGYHEFLLLCEDLKAEPVYVINSGITNQERRPRYEVITEMNKLVQDALDAIAYANAPVDSLFGKMRAKDGHPESFNLKYIEIGSENYGTEYMKRFQLFEEAINAKYPEITVISSFPVEDKMKGKWADCHMYADPDFFIANHARYEQKKISLNKPVVFIGEMGVIDPFYGGTLKAAIGEACFLIGGETYPQTVKHIAFAPVFGNLDYDIHHYPLLLFKKDQIVRTPSAYLFQLFASNRGNLLYPSTVETYSRPNVKLGRASIELFDNSYEITRIKIDGKPVTRTEIKRGNWTVYTDRLIPAANIWNYILLGDSGIYNYDFSATVKRTKGSDPIQLRIRDNGCDGEFCNCIGLSLGEEFVHLYYQAGTIKDTLVTPIRFPFVSHREYTISLKAADDLLQCRIDGKLICEVLLKPLPSLVAVATLDEKSNQLLLKVVNTTFHEEITELNLEGIHVKNNIEIIELAGEPEDKNSLQFPDRIIPVKKTYSFALGRPMIYRFPPHSISLLKMQF
ncbi:MAG: alpha-L-arabinofuranosidase C-terminal domain-containing protein [Massilibacteroides sp.]|nr:alpha-L-arabinofuranosidase C-terminal domain-containing protein [Massilibacteroides sp.]MDD4114980.1 alpha-L-arabinofuranosidase C-terminal domain-containing protein [Massilibacteroides sp.]MDD4659914.1 alpha-L-arabinofuranosidase C-terminal domain-containing protein [Massilibacteroides sp.]